MLITKRKTPIISGENAKRFLETEKENELKLKRLVSKLLEYEYPLQQNHVIGTIQMLRVCQKRIAVLEEALNGSS